MLHSSLCKIVDEDNLFTVAQYKTKERKREGGREEGGKEEGGRERENHLYSWRLSVIVKCTTPKYFSAAVYLRDWNLIWYKRSMADNKIIPGKAHRHYHVWDRLLLQLRYLGTSVFKRRKWIWNAMQVQSALSQYVYWYFCY